MAFITVVSGGSQPVFATDVLNPVAANATTSGTAVNFAGPKLDFFGVVANTTVAGQQNVSQYVANVIQGIQQTATVAMYQVDGTTLSFGVFPTGAFANTATFLAAANVPYTGFQLNTCTNVGFKLAVA